MSGGSLDYFCYTLEEHIGDFKDKELDDLVKDLVTLFHDREWYLSGDTGIGDWRESRDAFKEKWFAGNRQERLEKYLKEYIDEIRDAFGIRTEYCKTCKHWTQDEKGSSYGDCEFKKHCLMHRSECCGKYERKEGGE